MSRRSVGKELNTMEINQDNISNILVNNTKFNKVRKYEDFSWSITVETKAFLFQMQKLRYISKFTVQ